MKRLKLQLRKTACVFLSFVLAFGLCPITPSAALAKGNGDTGSTPVLTISGGKGKVPSLRAAGDIEVGTWGELQSAIDSVADGKTIVLMADITAGPDDTTLTVVREGVSFTIDLAGHTVNRNLSAKDDDNKGHVFGVNIGTLSIRDSSTGQSGKITGGYDENGGGIVIGGKGHLIVESGSITGNQAYNGGGIFVYGALTMTGGQVTGNTAGDCGGIYNHGGSIDLTGVSIANNTAQGAGGAGINNKGSAKLQDCTITGNAANTEGGGVYNSEDGGIELNGCTLSENTATGSGGAICSYGTLKSINSTFSQNTSTIDGGAICSYGATEINSATFTSNTATKSGGALRVYGGTVSLTSTTMSENKAEDRGGAIYINNGGSLNLVDSGITDNTGMNGGGGIWVADETAAVNIAGKVVVEENKANDVCLLGEKKLNLSGALSDGAHISVLLANSAGTFTTGFNEKNPGEDPEKYFEAEPGFSVLPDEAGEAMVVTSDWSHLQRQILEAPNGSTITLDKDWKAASQNTALVVSADKTLTLDLNGHKIDRNLFKGEQAVAHGGVIEVAGSLTLQDSAGGGVVMGGYSDAGGGIHVLPGATCTIEGGLIRDNKATKGGGIYNEGVLNIQGSNGEGGKASPGVVEDNSADSDGGGIYTLGTTTISGASITFNTANNGAGIYQDSGTLELNAKAQVNSNTAANDGAGVYLNAGTLALSDCTIGFNTAGREGGGIWNCGSGVFNVKGTPLVTVNSAVSGNNVVLGQAAGNVVHVVDSLTDKAKLDVMTKNSVDYAITSGLAGTSSTPKGGIDNFSYNGSGTDQLEMKDDGELYHKQTVADIEVNTWQAMQEALDNEAYTTIALSGDIVAGDNDIALSVKRNVTIDLNGKTINRNLAHTDAKEGSVIAFESGEATIKDSLGGGSITGGRTTYGGGLFIYEGATCSFEGGSVQGNFASKSGGGVYNAGRFVMRGGAVANNEAEEFGGGIFDCGILESTAGIVRDNTAGTYGGGISIQYESYDDTYPEFALSGLNVSGNLANIDGGGFSIYYEGEMNRGSLSGCSITDNTAVGVGGGIIFTAKGQALAISDTTIHGNIARSELSPDVEKASGGGGIFIDRGTVNMTGGSLSNNTAGYGGGVTLNNTTEFQADNVRMKGNKATVGVGGAIFNLESVVGVKNSTVTGNEAKTDGGAICSYGGSLTQTVIENDDFSNNSAHGSGGALFCSSGGTTVTNCTMTGNVAGERGGAFYNDSGARFYGATITGNSAGMEAGGVYVNGGTIVQGKMIVKDNVGSDMFLVGRPGAGMQIVKVLANLEGSSIGVSGSDGEGLVTEKFQENNPGVDPADIFFTEPGYSIIAGAGGDAEIVKSEWPQLQKQIRDAADGATIKLNRNWSAVDKDSPLTIPEGKTISIDLNGFTLNRNRSSADANGHVFDVSKDATLNTTDSSTDKNGTITGGYTEKGGGIVIQPRGTCNLQAGTVTGNRASEEGGGVYVGARST